MNQLPGSTKPVPLYRRRFFWAISLVAFVAVGAIAIWLMKETPLGADDPGKRGKIEISSHPGDATILLDGKDTKKRTPATISTKTGDHTLKLQLATYDEQEIKVQVREDATVKVEHVFTRDGNTVLSSPSPGQPARHTYRNDRYGYSMQYPSAWTVETDDEGIAHFYDHQPKASRENDRLLGWLIPGARAHGSTEDEESLIILAQPNPNDLPPEQWYQSREEYAAEDQSLIQKRSITVNGRPGFQYDTPYGFASYTITVVTGKKQAFLLEIKQGSPHRKIYDDIIQTFTLL